MDHDQEQQAIWDEELKAREAGQTTTPALKADEPSPDADVTGTGVTTTAEVPKTKTTDELLTEALNKIDKLSDRQRNVEGHIGGLTRNQNSMRENMTAAASAAAAVRDAPTKAQVTEALADPQEWDALKKDFPEWATATEKFLDARLSHVGKSSAVDVKAIEAMVTERIKGETAAVRQEIISSSLDAVFPGWADDVKTDGFGRWLGSQEAEVKALSESPHVGDAAKMLRLYEEAKRANPTTALLEQRKQKLANAAAAPRGVKTSAVKSPDDMSGQELWDYEARQRDSAGQPGSPTSTIKTHTH